MVEWSDRWSVWWSVVAWESENDLRDIWHTVWWTLSLPTKGNTCLRQPISVQARVAITLWRLATNNEYRTLSELFGVRRSTVGEIMLETYKVIANRLLPKYVQVPNNGILRGIVDGFGLRWGFPQTVGGIDGTHLPFIKPVHSAADYYNKKGYYSVLMQGLVNFRGRFINVNIGWPGMVHNAWVLVKSSLYKDANDGKLSPIGIRTWEAWMLLC